MSTTPMPVVVIPPNEAMMRPTTRREVCSERGLHARMKHLTKALTPSKPRSMRMNPSMASPALKGTCLGRWRYRYRFHLPFPRAHLCSFIFLPIRNVIFVQHPPKRCAILYCIFQKESHSCTVPAGRPPHWPSG